MNSKKRRVTSSLKCSQITLIVKHSLGDSGFSIFFDHLVLYPTRVLKFYRFCLDTFDIMIVIRIIYGKTIFLLINDLSKCRDKPSGQSDEKLRGHNISRIGHFRNIKYSA